MATILKFESRPRAASKRDVDPGTANGAARGEVVIFPGVRLERHAVKLSDRLPDPDPGKPGVKRRHRVSGK
jgi:hypothetical protein